MKHLAHFLVVCDLVVFDVGHNTEQQLLCLRQVGMYSYQKIVI